MSQPRSQPMFRVGQRVRIVGSRFWPERIAPIAAIRRGAYGEVVGVDIDIDGRLYAYSPRDLEEVTDERV